MEPEAFRADPNCPDLRRTRAESQAEAAGGRAHSRPHGGRPRAGVVRRMLLILPVRITNRGSLSLTLYILT